MIHCQNEKGRFLQDETWHLGNRKMGFTSGPANNFSEAIGTFLSKLTKNMIEPGQLRVWWTSDKLFMIVEQLSQMPAEVYPKYRILQEGQILTVSHDEILDMSLYVPCANS
jgi:hypothetical protein